MIQSTDKTLLMVPISSGYWVRERHNRETDTLAPQENLKRPINIIGRIYYKSLYFQEYLVEILITELLFLLCVCVGLTVPLNRFLVPLPFEIKLCTIALPTLSIYHKLSSLPLSTLSPHSVIIMFSTYFSKKISFQNIILIVYINCIFFFWFHKPKHAETSEKCRGRKVAVAKSASPAVLISILTLLTPRIKH